MRRVAVDAVDHGERSEPAEELQHARTPGLFGQGALGPEPLDAFPARRPERLVGRGDAREEPRVGREHDGLAAREAHHRVVIAPRPLDDDHPVKGRGRARQRRDPMTRVARGLRVPLAEVDGLPARGPLQPDIADEDAARDHGRHARAAPERGREQPREYDPREPEVDDEGRRELETPVGEGREDHGAERRDEVARDVRRDRERDDSEVRAPGKPAAVEPGREQGEQPRP